MKFCFHCGNATGGEPLFCNSCGRSYDVKLCSRRHVNPRSAEVCSQCGSRELSTPQPKVPFWWKSLGFLLQLVSGILLVLFSLWAAIEALKSPAGQNAMILLGLLFAVLWALWVMLPEWLRELVHALLKKRGRGRE
jgi:hypothetical protein